MEIAIFNSNLKLKIMDFKTKRNLKRKAKFFYTLGWITFGIAIICFSIFVVALIIGAKNSIALPKYGITSIYIFFSCTILAFILAFSGELFAMQLKEYREKIEKSRQQRYFQRIMIAVKENDLKKAVNIYDNLLKDKNLRDYCYSFLINEMIHDDTWKKKGEILINKFIENNKPTL